MYIFVYGHKYKFNGFKHVYKSINKNSTQSPKLIKIRGLNL